MKNGCPQSDDVQARSQEVSLHSVDPDYQGNFCSLLVEANATVYSRSILELSHFHWFLNGERLSSLGILSYLQMIEPTHLSQGLEWFNTQYKYSGRVEVLLDADLDSYFTSRECRPYYVFVTKYLPGGEIDRGYTDIEHYEGTNPTLHFKEGVVLPGEASIGTGMLWSSNSYL